MKKLFLIAVGTLFLSSCVSTKLVNYDEDGVCRPTLDGYQQLENLKYENPNETYFWNYKQCKWITKSEQEQIIDDVFDSIKLPLKN